MNSLEMTISPPNSIIFIADPSGRYDVPTNTGGVLVTSTPSCIGVGTLAEMDGETTVKLGESLALPGDELVFDGVLETPGLRIAVIDSGATTLLSMSVRTARTQVRVWVNDPDEPDVILIQAR